MNRTILLVEDSEDDVFFMRRALKQAGVANPLQVCMDGQAALDYLEGRNEFLDRTRFPLPSLVLLDLRLPLVPGLEVLRQTREKSRFNHIPIVILTSSKHDADVREAYSNGANSYLVKPTEFSDLVAMVRGLWDYWLRFNYSPQFT